jgi:hypothetical protein
MLIARPLSFSIRAAWLALLLSVAASPAVAQQSMSDVLTFLLTNRSIPTGDFVRDEQAAASTSDVMARFVTLELATLPIASSAAGFTYRLDPTLGTVVRSSDSFGPFFVERSLTSGRGQSSLSIGYRSTAFTNIDGRSLRDGTLVSTASTLRGETAPFDVETVALRLRTDTMTLTGNVGVTDRLDIGGAIPYVRVSLQGERVDNYRGRPLVQATGAAAASGLGDVVVRTKYNVFRDGGSGVAIAAEARLPTGREEDLLGAGHASLTPRAIASYEARRVGVHGEVGYSFRDVAQGLGYAAALTVIPSPRLTLVGEVSGARLTGVGRLGQITQAHPTLVGVDTVRLTSVEAAVNRAYAVAGLKWNLANTWLLTANVRRPLTESGLNAGWVPTITLDYAFGG